MESWTGSNKGRCHSCSIRLNGRHFATGSTRDCQSISHLMTYTRRATNVLYDGSTPIFAERSRLISIRSQTRSTCRIPQSCHAKSGNLQVPPVATSARVETIRSSECLPSSQLVSGRFCPNFSSNLARAWRDSHLVQSVRPARDSEPPPS
jgi:hypothetical protein